jgi:hypothetical protein
VCFEKLAENSATFGGNNHHVVGRATASRNFCFHFATFSLLRQLLLPTTGVCRGDVGELLNKYPQIA